MKPNVFLRIVAPVLAISILPLIVGVVAAWRVHADQKSASTRSISTCKAFVPVRISRLESGTFVRT